MPQRRLALLVPVAAVLVAACAGEPLPTESPLAPATGQATLSITSDSRGPAGKVDICHVTGNGRYLLINVNQNAEPAHLGHGDAKPGDEVPGSGGLEIFDAECVPEPVVAECGPPGGGGPGPGPGDEFDPDFNEGAHIGDGGGVGLPDVGLPGPGVCPGD